MYDRLLVMWKDGRLTESMVDSAVKKTWITPAQGEAIKATPRDDAAVAAASAL
jgi:hypothetical protein